MTRMGAGGARPASPRPRTGCPPCTRVGAPLRDGRRDVPWPCNDTKYITHFPETREIWSFGSGVRRERAAGQEGLRPAHRLGHRPRRGLAGRAHAHPQDDLAARPRVPPGRGVPVGLRQDQPRHAAADAFRAGPSRPSATTSRGCGPGRTAACAPSTPRPGSSASRRAPARTPTRRAIETLWGNTIFTNVALRDDGDVWWEGLTENTPGAPHRLAGQRLDAGIRHSRRRTRTPGSPSPRASARRSRTAGTTRRASCSTRSSSAAAGPRTCRWWPRRANWEHGVLLGAMVSSERTAAAEGTVGELRRDPFAMMPFCGYNMADHWSHWLEVGAQLRQDRQGAAHLPGQLVPQGRGRQLPVAGLRARTPACSSGSWAGSTARSGAVDTPLGFVPTEGGINVDGLELADERLARTVRDRRRAVARGTGLHRGVLRPVRRPACRRRSPASSPASAPGCTASSRIACCRWRQPVCRHANLLSAPQRFASPVRLGR